MDSRNRIFSLIYLICGVLGFLRGLLALRGGHPTGVVVLRFALGVLFLLAALYYRKKG